MNFKNILDKGWEEKPVEEILNAPVEILKGVSPSDGQKLKEAFNIKTVRDLATCKFFLWAQALNAMSTGEYEDDLKRPTI